LNSTFLLKQYDNSVPKIFFGRFASLKNYFYPNERKYNYISTLKYINTKRLSSQIITKVGILCLDDACQECEDVEYNVWYKICYQLNYYHIEIENYWQPNIYCVVNKNKFEIPKSRNSNIISNYILPKLKYFPPFLNMFKIQIPTVVLTFVVLYIKMEIKGTTVCFYIFL